MNRINKIMKIEDWHDLPIICFEYKIEEKQISIEFAKFNEISQEYDPLVLKFICVKKFYTNKPESDEYYLEELFRIYCKRISKNLYKTQLRILLGFGKPDFLITIYFKNLKLIRKKKSLNEDN
jgi:hypothetical protein